MNAKIYAAILVLLIFSGCGSGTPKTGNIDKKLEFKPASVPAMLETPESRAEYVGKHYWDNFDFTDTMYVDEPITEQAFADYVNILGYLPANTARASINDTFDNASADTAMFRYFDNLADKYLYDPNSPMLNEELYIMVLEYMLASDKVGELEKLRPAHRLEMALKNRIGNKAADFQYVTTEGKTSSLYKIKANYTLIFFNNPGCAMCKDITEAILASPVFEAMISSGEMKILALYPDEEITEWTNYASNIPVEWINAHDPAQAINKNSLYDLRAIPSLYLLDRDKKVLLKDAPFERVQAYFLTQTDSF